ncbi:MAG: hypothetical protein U0531_04675 [Dehalococcoidia bacterium]
MARILLLGTWLTTPDRTAINERNGGRLTFSGLPGQMEISGPRIEIERSWVVNERTWKNGMPRSIVSGQIESFTDDLFVVIDEAPAHDPRRRRPE